MSTNKDIVLTDINTYADNPTTEQPTETTSTNDCCCTCRECLRCCNCFLDCWKFI